MYKVKTLQHEYLFSDVSEAYSVYAALADAGVTVQICIMMDNTTGPIEFMPVLTAN